MRVFGIQTRKAGERTALAYLSRLCLFLVKATGLLAFLHLRRRYDVIHVHNLPDFLVLGAVVPRVSGARVILDIHDIMPELYKERFGKGPSLSTALLLAERLSCWFADHVIVANDIWRERLVQRAVPASKCTTILNYPDLNLFNPSTYSSRCDSKAFVFLYPGSLSAHQGVDVAIRAMAAVKDRIPGGELHIYGDGPARPDLEELALSLNMEDRVKFFKGIPMEELSQIMASAHAGIEPKGGSGFANEALSTKILEFMASGLPVLASRTRAHAHYFDDSVVKFFAAGDAAELAEKMAWLYEHRCEHDEWTQRGIDLAAKYGWQSRVEDYLAVTGAFQPSRGF